MHVASPVQDDIPSQQNISREGEIPCSKPQASPAHEAPKVSASPTIQQQQIPVEQPQSPPVVDSTLVPTVKEPALLPNASAAPLLCYQLHLKLSYLSTQ